MQDIAAYLDAEPTVIRLVFLISDLKTRLDSAPTAGIGLLDVIEALMPKPESGTQTKKDAMSRARIAASRGAPDEALRCYFLLSDRLRRPAFQNATNDIGEAIRKGVHDLVVSNPAVGITEQNRMSLSSLSETPSSYFNGLLDGLEEIAQSRPADLLALCHNDDLAIAAIQARPEIAAGLMSIPPDHDADAKSALANWIRLIRSHESRTSLRQHLFPKISHDSDIAVLSELLTDIDAHDVPGTLEVLFGPTRGFNLVSARRALKEQISERFPEPTRKWAINTHCWSRGAAEIIAATFARNLEGTDELLNCYQLKSDKYVETWAAFLDQVTAQRLPNWLVRHAAEDAKVVAPFLRGGNEKSPLALQCFARLLEECPYIPIAREPELMAWFESIDSLPCFDLLIGRTIQSVFREFIIGKIEIDIHRRWLNQAWAIRWLANVPFSQLVQHAIYFENTDAWGRCWVSVESLPDITYERTPAVIPDVVRALLRSNVVYWTPAIAESWRAILKRAKTKTEWTGQLRLYADALRLEFCTSRDLGS
jgi:hypothetical protein